MTFKVSDNQYGWPHPSDHFFAAPCTMNKNKICMNAYQDKSRHGVFFMS